MYTRVTDVKPWACCALIRGIKRAPVLDAVRSLVVARHPHRRLPGLLAHAVLRRLVSLPELAALCEGGQHYPLLLEVLQALKTLVGPERLAASFAESKVNLAGSLREGAALAEAVESRGLAALVPQLRVQAELARALASEPAPAALYRWIKANVEPAVRANASFVSALVALLARHVAAEASSAETPLEREKSLVEAYAPLLTALLEARPDLQLAAVYAVQVHAHDLRYPKGESRRPSLKTMEPPKLLACRRSVTDLCSTNSANFFFK